MSVVVELSEYAFQMILLQSEKTGESVENVLLSFFESGCIAPAEASAE